MADEAIAGESCLLEDRHGVYIWQIRPKEDFDEANRGRVMIDRLQSHKVWGVSFEGQKGRKTA